MGFREVSVVEVREVLRAWLAGAGLRTVTARAGVDRKTARRYVEAARAAGLTREVGATAVTDELVGLVVEAVRPARPNGHGAGWETLLGHEEQIRSWVAGSEVDGVKQAPLSIVKIEELLARQGVRVPYRTLHRFAVERCGFRTGRGSTVRVVDGEPGVEGQIDFAQMGLLLDPETGRRRRVHALIFTAVLSRHMFVWFSYSQTQTAVIAGCEAAWAFFGGAFKVLIPDNLTPVVPKADAVNPRFSVGWLDYAQHVGFGTDPARVRSPQDKPRVERVVQYVRGNFWAGETFADLADAQARVEAWCTPPGRDADPRHHPASPRSRCSPSSKRAVCCRSRRPMTSRSSPGSRCTATSTSRSPRRSTRSPSSSSAGTCRPAPTASWSSSTRSAAPLVPAAAGW